MRHPRILVSGAEYHVIARANRGEFILNSPKMKQLFLDIVQRAKRKYSFSIRTFCIMSNHVHMMIRPDRRESLSRIMQWILSVFAVTFNRIFGYAGHVWYDRFKSRVIDSFRHFIATFVYIAENPVRAHLATSAAAYPFNGVRRIRDGDFAVVDYPGAVLRLLFSDLLTSRLLPFVETYPLQPENDRLRM